MHQDQYFCSQIKKQLPIKLRMLNSFYFCLQSKEKILKTTINAAFHESTMQASIYQHKPNAFIQSQQDCPWWQSPPQQGRDPSWDLAAVSGSGCLSHLQDSRGSVSSCHVTSGTSQVWKSLGLIPTVFCCLDHRPTQPCLLPAAVVLYMSMLKFSSCTKQQVFLWWDSYLSNLL